MLRAMSEQLKYPSVMGVRRPSRKYGRLPSANNDSELVARALAGLDNSIYRSYRDAATKLATESRTYHKGKYWTPESETTIIDRLRRKISEANKKRLQTSSTHSA